LAALKGSIPIVDLLIQKYHVNMVHTNGEQMVLTIACRENRVELVEHLVKTYGCNIHVNHEKHLRNACLYGYHDLVHFLLSLDVDVHAYHDAAIQNAAYKGFSSIVKMLLDAGAYADANQNACIQYAITNNDLETVQHLIQAGVHPRSDNDWPLRHACRRGLDAIVLYLLDCIGEHGPNVQEGMPLEEALMHGHVSIVRILLDRGANPNSRKAIRGLRYIVNPKSKTLNKDTMISMLTNAGL
ncbi:ankyrin repeat-containing domain protein, partial [Gilbertella persicaria]|uniref:ankyrin repeat-containing domain protein n=1 Tax=Gilbertella persicaria TaxID=101096 RepID=UPI00221E964D